MKLVKGFHIRNIADEILAVPTGEVAKVLSGLVTLNETGAFLFGLLIEEQSEESLLKALVTKYDVSEEDAEKDIAEFIGVLRHYNLVSED
ncbi:MAG: PqqD family protein [Eubacteriales bacterium]|nr:PqqD family protein [Eubacteriales bacterium]